MRKSWVYILLTGAILLVYLLVLNRYGTAIPASTPPEEVNLAALAQSIAEGKGAFFTIPSDIVPSPQETPRRFYVPVLSYAFALSGWGSLWGFDLLSLRWFNRVLGALNLLLLIGLARRWGIPRGLALLAAFWTAMDIVYQLVSNVIRSDMFSLFGVFLGLWTFTNGQERREYGWWLASGACFALALFAHFWQVFYVVVWLALNLLWNRRWKELTVFLAPCAAAGFLWFLYGLQDWEWFRFLSSLMLEDKTSWNLVILAFWLMGFHTFQKIWGVYPSNSPIWLAVLLTLTWAWYRRRLTAPLWQWGVFWIAYVTTHVSPHPWYAGWFTPFGYLALALLASQILRPWPRGWIARGLVVLALLWSGYQAVQVGRCWQAAPAIHRAHQKFFQELAETLPSHGSFWLRSVPDPSFFLRKSRPDLTLYVASGYFSYPDFFHRLDGAISVYRPRSLSEWPPHRIQRIWQVPGVLEDYYVLWLEPSSSD